MKILGQITPEYEDSEEFGTICKNASYVSGHIIAFTPKETTILRMLQSAIDGDVCRHLADYDSILKPPDEGGIDTALWLVYQFVKARFAVNEFAQAVDELENTLMKIDEGLRGELDEL